MQFSTHFSIPLEMQQYLLSRGPSHPLGFPHDIPLSPPPCLGLPHNPSHPQHHFQQHHHLHPQPQLAPQHPYHPIQQTEQQQNLNPAAPQLPQFEHPHECQQQQAIQRPGSASESTEAPSPLAVSSSPKHSSPNSYKQAITVRESLEDDEAIADDSEKGMGISRWPRQESLALLKIRSEMDAKFRDSSHKGPLWDEVSRRLLDLGYSRSAKKCKEKFENVYKYYKKTKEGRAGRQDGKVYRFFGELDALFGGSNSVIQTGTDDMETGMLLRNAEGRAGCFTNMAGATANRSTFVQGPVEIDSDLVFSSNSSEDEHDGPHERNHGGIRKKRKRKSSFSSKIMFYLEAIVKKVMDRQEAMHQKLLETIERREQEILAREEAWRRQEIARLNREHELRAQENAFATARDTALFAFLQKVTDQTLPLSQVVPPPPLTIPDVQEQDKDPYDLSSKRWPKSEVQHLIRLRIGMESRFQEPGPKWPLWEEISTGMACLGYDRNAKRCKEKWENINKYFKKAKDSNRKRPENSKTCPYFHQLDSLYKKGVLGSPISKTDKVDGVGNKQDEVESAHHGRADMLGLMPPNENASVGDNPITAVQQEQLHANSENRNSGNGGYMIGKIKQNIVENGNMNTNSPPKKLNDLQAAKELSGMQQHQQLNHDKYNDKIEQDVSMRQEESLEQQELPLVQDNAHLSSRSAALMALAHKFTEITPEFTLTKAVEGTPHL